MQWSRAQLFLRLPVQLYGLLHCAGWVEEEVKDVIAATAGWLVWAGRAHLVDEPREYGEQATLKRVSYTMERECCDVCGGKLPPDLDDLC